MRRLNFKRSYLAEALYVKVESIHPAKGPRWDELTEERRDFYRDCVEVVEREQARWDGLTGGP